MNQEKSEKNLVRTHVHEFFEFIRKQGVIGLAVGFILGGAITKTVTSLVNDIINPLIGALFGGATGLAEKTFMIGTIAIHWGSFISSIIDFLIIAAVVYFGVKWLKLDKLNDKEII